MTIISLPASDAPTRERFEHKGKTYTLDYPEVKVDPVTNIPNAIYLTDDAKTVHGEFIFENHAYGYRDLYHTEGFPEKIIQEILHHLNLGFTPPRNNTLYDLLNMDTSA